MLVLPTELQRTEGALFLIPLSWLPVLLFCVNSVEKFEAGDDDHLYLMRVNGNVMMVLVVGLDDLCMVVGLNEVTITIIILISLIFSTM